MLAISTSSIFFSLPMISSASSSLCLGDLQWRLFYTSIPLIVVGVAGQLSSLDAFLLQQIPLIRSAKDQQQLINQMPQIMFGIICLVVATLQFFLRSSSYIRVKPSGSRITSLFRVIMEACIKIQLSCPQDPRELYKKYDLGNDQELLPHTNHLRFLDKAAILTRSQTIKEQENQKWRFAGSLKWNKLNYSSQ
ncbi:unnamed protein product [Ilex paraguariensis]|uniref:Uncharacterized protein n=1 Tax=Ilex paraguariensis TaxID=185542 RepID=A0ABC8QTL0_9AQUA